MQLEHEQALKASSDAFGTRRRAVEDHVDGIRQAEEARREHALEDGAFWGCTPTQWSPSRAGNPGRDPLSGRRRAYSMCHLAMRVALEEQNLHYQGILQAACCIRA